MHVEFRAVSPLLPTKMANYLCSSSHACPYINNDSMADVSRVSHVLLHVIQTRASLTPASARQVARNV